MTKISISVLTVLTAAGLTLSAQQTAAPKAAPAKPAATAKKSTAKVDPDSVLPPGVPAGSKPYKRYYWRYVDKDGVAWIYHRTPFGIVHDQESDEDRAEHAASMPRPEIAPGDLTIVDKGDSLEFAQQTPFGASKWTTKKTQLSTDEAAAWAKYKAAEAQKK